MITLLGIVAGFALIISAMILGGSPLAFVDVPSILIVLGGTVAITIVSFSPKDLQLIPGALWHMMTYTPLDPREAGVTMIQISERARKQGLMSLEKLTSTMNNEPFLQKALNLTVDGASVEEIEQILQKEIHYTASIQSKSVDLLRRAAEVAPAMGLIGTLVGLVQMLGNLSDPSTIGPAMSVALLTTFYGAVLAHMVLMPLATKAERNSQNESTLNALYLTGALSISREENPRRLEMQLNAMLPQTHRIRYFE
ncbi:motility protein A [Luteithermobacter gelatinilyticus]|uniref:motility protein A n=1 Tax=Luteithermobacter gelatinilyticus TaxID=2582913 RepID=UPI001AEFBD75|nr:MotA/TolQ/ExbB proton channel family protein [Luteithermobacter gelatinilyticus]